MNSQQSSPIAQHRFKKEYRAILPRFRSEFISGVLYFCMLGWTLMPHHQVRAAYVPDENHNPTWAPTAGESASASYNPNTNDDDGNGVPDWEDTFNDMAANGLFVYWPGGTWVIDGVSTSFGGQWHAPSADSDGDLLPDDLDTYPSDASNNSFFWAGGTFTFNNIVHTFRSDWYAGSETDGNSNGVPDTLDDWFTNPSMHGTLQHWNGGTLIINGESNTYAPVDYYAAAFVDSDGDGVPDEIDAYPSDPWNNTNFPWAGGDYYIDGALTHFPPATYGGVWSDTDGDSIPDVVDPGPNDSGNNSAWWGGGQFTIDGTAQTFPGQYHRADANDTDGDGIPDDIDPFPSDNINWHSFSWQGGTFFINNQNQFFDAASYYGTWSDSDGDGIPDVADPYPSDANNANVTDQYYWAGGYYTVDNNNQFLGGTTYSGSWSDQDGDGIPDPADAYPNDTNNGNSTVTEFYWSGGVFTVDHQTTVFNAGNYLGTWSDQDGDGIPDSLDAYVNDAYNGNDNFYWAGGYYTVDNNNQFLGGTTYSGSWSDQDGDGIPDPADAYPNDTNNGNNTTSSFPWSGGRYRVNNVDEYFEGGTYEGSWSDQDSDGIPDVVDVYPTDAGNGNSTFYWAGGTYRIQDSDQTFAANTYPGVWSDTDGDGIPDSLDPYPDSATNGNSQFYWGGGSYRANNSDISFEAGYYGGTWADSDSDGIPDSVDPYPSDSSNNCNEFWWQGGLYSVNSLNTFFAPGYYAGVWADEDGDSIPDPVDPYPNNSYNMPYWAGGSWQIDDISTYFGPRYLHDAWLDSDGDGIPDELDPHPSSSENGNSGDPPGDPPPPPATFQWSGGTFHVNGVEVNWPDADYAGTWADSDSDGIPDSLDYWATDSTNNSEYWAGGSWQVDGASRSFIAQWHRTNAGDSDADGLPNDIDPYPGDALNNNGFTWPTQVTTFTVTNQEQTFSPIHYGGVWVDSDNDGIPDVTDPLPNDHYNGNDTDGDGIPDSVEVLYSGILDPANPGDVDTLRADGITYAEAFHWFPSLPLTQTLSASQDTDGDHMPDAFEIAHGLNPTVTTDALASRMGDYVTNLEKYQHNLNLDILVTPAQIETAFGQSWSDFLNHRVVLLSNAENDWDGDGVSNVDELLLFHTKPRVATDKPTLAQIKQAFATTGLSETTLLNFRNELFPPNAGNGNSGSSSGGATTNGVPNAPLAGSALDPTTSTAPSTHLLSGHDISLEPPALSDIQNQIVTGIGGAFQVGADGSANFSMPLVLPKGTAGMEPQLSLAYDSDGPDGLMGPGWSVAGLGSITRGGSSYQQDGVSTGITFSKDDRFFFNGERLVYVGSRSDFATTSIQDGDEFRTEMNQFSRILYHRPTSASPTTDYWTVETKGGITFTFGGASDARIAPEVSNQNEAITWALNYAEDLKRNYFIVTYERDFISGGSGPRFMDFAPSTVEYTGNAGASSTGSPSTVPSPAVENTGNAGVSIKPYIQVKFNYVAREQATFANIKGGTIRSNKRLNTIAIRTAPEPLNPGDQTQFSANADRYYQLGYERSAVTGRNRLIQVQEWFAKSTGGYSPSLPTRFEWVQGTPGWGLPQTGAEWQIPALAQARAGDTGMRFIDMDGDGIDDLIWKHNLGRKITGYYNRPAPGAIVYEAAGAQAPSSFTTSNGNDHPSGALKGLGQGFNSSAAPAAWVPPAFLSGRFSPSAASELIDIDGDGRVDVLTSGSFLCGHRMGMWNTDGGAVNWNPSFYLSNRTAPVSMVFNWATNWRDDFTLSSGTLLGVSPGVTGAFIGTGDGWGASSPRFVTPIPIGVTGALSTGLITDGGRRFIDLNGDGFPDLVNGLSGDSPNVWLNRGPDNANNATNSAWDNTSPEAKAYAKVLCIANNTANPGWSNPAEVLTTKSGGVYESSKRTFLDLNGDALPDLQVSYYTSVPAPTTSTTTTLTPAVRKDRIYLNTGRGWNKVYDSDVISAAPTTWTTTPAPARDVLVYPRTGTSAITPPTTSELARLDLPLSQREAWLLPQAMLLPNSGLNQNIRAASFQDVNGDGLPDYILSLEYYGTNNLPIPERCLNFVYLNLGDRFSTTPSQQWVLPGYLSVVRQTSSTATRSEASLSRLVDINGDGLPDFVSTFGKGSKNNLPDRSGVWLNTGSGWAPDDALLSAWTTPLANAALTGDARFDETETTTTAVTYTRTVSASPNDTVQKKTTVTTVTSIPGQPQVSETSISQASLQVPHNTIPAPSTTTSIVSKNSIPNYDALAGSKSPSWVIPTTILNLRAPYTNPADAYGVDDSGTAYQGNLLDLNNDSYPDYIQQTDAGATTVWLNQTKPEVIQRVFQSEDPAHGMGIITEVGYQPMNKPLTDSFTGLSVYTRAVTPVVKNGIGKTTAVETIGPRLLVYKVGTENGVGGTKETHYRYGGALASTQGRGDLGFAWIETWSNVQEKDSTNKVRSRSLTEFDQTYPFAGTAVRSRLFIERYRTGLTAVIPAGAARGLPPNNEFGAPWQLLTDSSTNCADLPAINGFTVPWHFIFTQSQTETTYDLESGVLAGTSTSSTEYANNTARVDNPTRQVAASYRGTAVETNLINRVTTVSAYESNTEPGSGQPWLLGRLHMATATHEARGQTGGSAITKRSAFTYYAANSQWPGMLKEEIVEPNDSGAAANGSVVKTTEYDAVGNAIAVTSSAPDRTMNGHPYSVAPRSARDDFTDTRKRFSTATHNALGHTATKDIDPTKATVTSTTDVNGFKTGFQYDTFGTLVETTSYQPNGTTPFVRAVKYVKFVTLAALPQVRYATITHASGSLPSATYHDKFGRVVLTESVGFGGRCVLAQTLFDDEGKAPAARRPFFMGDKTLFNSIAQVPSDAMGLLANDDWSRGFIDEAGRVVRTVGVGSAVSSSGGTLTSSGDVVTTSTSYEVDTITAKITSSGYSETTVTKQVTVDGYWARQVTDSRGGADKDTLFFSTPDGLDWKTRTPTGSEIVKTYSTGRRELTSITDPDAGTSTMEYDGFGQVRRSVNATGDETTIDYDLLGRVTTKHTPAGDYTTVYDTLTGAPNGTWKGMAASTTGPLIGGGVGATETITSVIDSFGRATSTTQTLSRPTNLDGTGPIITETNTSSVVYDDSHWGRVVQSTDPGGFVTRPVYDSAYGYSTGTNAVFPEGGVSVERNVITVNSVDAQGRTLKTTAGNGAIATNDWDVRTGRLMASKLEDGNTAGLPLIDQQFYTSDNRGNILTRSRPEIPARGTNPALPAQTETFTYDDLDRLTTSQVGGKTQQTFTFDAWGNIHTKSGVGEYNYNAARSNRLANVKRSSDIYQRFKYDAAGRITGDYFTSTDEGTTVIAGSRERSFTYTSFGQVSHISATEMPPTTTAPADVTRWAYTSLDFWFGVGGTRLRQVQQQVRSYDPTKSTASNDPHALRVTTTYLGGMDVVQEETLYDGTWGMVSLEKKHYFPGGEFVEKDAAPPGLTTMPTFLLHSETVSYYQGDHLGSTNAITDQDGNETERQSFSPWGERRDATNWDSNTKAGTATNPSTGLPVQQSISSRHKPGYTGHEMLDAVGIIHMNGRLYDPELGRMMSPDPVIASPGDSQCYSAYTYVRNNPMKLTDPSGFVDSGGLGWRDTVGLLLGAMKQGMSMGEAQQLSVFQLVTSFGANAKPWTYLGAAYTIGKIGGEAVFKQWQQTSKSIGWKNARNRLYKQWGVPEPHTPKKNWFRIFVTIAISVALVAIVPASAGILVQGAAVGAATNASLTAIQGGSWGDILKAGLTGAVTGAISAGIANGIGDMFVGNGVFSGIHGPAAALLKAGLHGVAQGAISAATGGSFRDGFIGAATGSLLSPALGVFGPTKLGQTIGAALVGGTASVLAGGKFANGAISAAFTHLYNDLGQGHQDIAPPPGWQHNGIYEGIGDSWDDYFADVGRDLVGYLKGVGRLLSFGFYSPKGADWQERAMITTGSGVTSAVLLASPFGKGAILEDGVAVTASSTALRTTAAVPVFGRALWSGPGMRAAAIADGMVVMPEMGGVASEIITLESMKFAAAARGPVVVYVSQSHLAAGGANGATLNLELQQVFASARAGLASVRYVLRP